MGDVADTMIEGILCQNCGVFISASPTGYARNCADCKPIIAQISKVTCSICKRKVKHNGLKDHMRDAHGVKI